jgi:phosphatidylglycerophosphate synthase
MTAPAHAEGEAPRSRLGWLPGALTWARLAALPVLWVVALMQLPAALAVGTAAAALTDVLDGILARRLGVTSERGGALDSLADHLLSISLFAWLLMLRPEFFREQLVPLALWISFALFVLAVGWLRRGQMVNLHLLSTKVAGTVGYVFGILLLFTGGYSTTVFAIAMALVWIAAVEALLVILTGRDLRAHAAVMTRRRS